MKRLLLLLKVFLTWVVACMASKLLFMAAYASLLNGTGVADWAGVVWHGLRLDLAVASYLSVIPMLFIIVSRWVSARVLRWIWNAYFALTSFLVATAFVVNIGLYGYWGFPLDTTPVFYFMTSPADAMASMEWWMMLLGVVAIAVLALAIYCPFRRMGKRIAALSTAGSGSRKTKRLPAIALETVATLICGFALFFFIRGGFTVAANNVGSVYFSENIRLNHAAVNPVFSFLESATHDEDFQSKYRFMDDDEATKLFAQMCYTEQRDSAEISREPLNVIVVVLESFSRYIMDDGGHVTGITPCLDSLKHEGLYFTNFYANSFRTDRGLMAILSGYPAQPTMSLMKYPRKTNNLYGMARSLRQAGYDTQYVYGGDANFTNMRSYLMATGFNRVVSEEDYDKSLRTGKWGVNDSVLFDKALAVMPPAQGGGARRKGLFTVVQTSSSHEPFDVPMHAMKNERLNAFHYTDYCLGRYVDQLKKRSDWEHTMLVVVADHLGCYPEDMDNFQLYRYHIPLIITGGAIKERRQIATLGSQHDIPATLLPMLGLSHSEFTFSKDMLDERAPHFAFFAVPDAMGMVTTENAVIYDNVSGKTVLDTGRQRGRNLPSAKAYLQKMYDDIGAR